MRGARRVIVDSDGPDSLASVALAWRGHAEWLLVGSAGLARQVARAAALPASQEAAAPTDQAANLAMGPILVVAGSPAAATRQQLAVLEAATTAADGEVVVLATAPASARDDGQAARGLAELVVAWAASHPRPRAVVLAGGATARLICERLGVTGVKLTGELQPGVPWAPSRVARGTTSR
jgi:uncharacterized protein YgbK (DUF1537 family)